MMLRNKLLMAGCLALLASGVQANTPTRYEAEAMGDPRNSNDICGYDSVNGVVGRDFDEAASNGEILYTSGVNRNFKFIFKGTGVDLIGRQDIDGAPFIWIINGGTPSEISGTGTQFGEALVHQQRFPIAASGSLPNALHTLEIRRDVGDGALRVDAIDVYDDGQRSYVDQVEDTFVTFSPDAWVLEEFGADSLFEAYGGTTAWSIVDGATVKISFNGTGIALLTMVRWDSKTFDWDIDGVRSGTINAAAGNALNFGFWHRWPYLLANDLPPGNHTLTITNASGWVNFVDAFVIDGTPIEPFEPTTPGDINGDGEINVVDVTALGNLIAAGTPPGLAVGDINDDGAVNELDMQALADLIVGP
jgi:hypothetical protein